MAKRIRANDAEIQKKWMEAARLADEEGYSGTQLAEHFGHSLSWTVAAKKKGRKLRKALAKNSEANDTPESVDLSKKKRPYNKRPKMVELTHEALPQQAKLKMFMFFGTVSDFSKILKEV